MLEVAYGQLGRVMPAILTLLGLHDVECGAAVALFCNFIARGRGVCGVCPFYKLVAVLPPFPRPLKATTHPAGLGLGLGPVEFSLKNSRGPGPAGLAAGLAAGWLVGLRALSRPSLSHPPPTSISPLVTPELHRQLFPESCPRSGSQQTSRGSPLHVSNKIELVCYMRSP